MIYFVEAVGVPLIKIGYSSNPTIRIMALQGQSPIAVREISVIEGEKDDETALHQRFQAIRSHGEWFFATRELRALAEGREVSNVPRPSIIGEPIEGVYQLRCAGCDLIFERRYRGNQRPTGREFHNSACFHSRHRGGVR